MGKGLPPNWQKKDEYVDKDEGVHLHYFNPEKLERLVVREHTSPFTHKHKYIIESSVSGVEDSAKSIEEARRKANAYMAENVAFS